LRLWHQDLLPKLPREQLLGQHRECCALRGGGWGKNHSTVNYVFDHCKYKLYAYHMLVIQEMQRRCYVVDAKWLTPPGGLVYDEHDTAYRFECEINLEHKGVTL